MRFQVHMLQKYVEITVKWTINYADTLFKTCIDFIYLHQKCVVGQMMQ